MIKKSLPLVILSNCLFLLIFCGCAMPQILSKSDNCRSAMEQNLIVKALRKSLGQSPNVKIPFAILQGMKVIVKVSSISGSGDSCNASEDARFIESLIKERLLEENAIIVNNSGTEDAVVQVAVETFGTDSFVRSFPHLYFPLCYYITYSATVSISIYAYNAKGEKTGMLLNYHGEGGETKSEWALFGFGPF
ncbi:MAG: hypothetical protein ABIH42_03170 [Planctomycetota bacterium]